MFKRPLSLFDFQIRELIELLLTAIEFEEFYYAEAVRENKPRIADSHRVNISTFTSIKEKLDTALSCYDANAEAVRANKPRIVDSHRVNMSTFTSIKEKLDTALSCYDAEEGKIE